MQKGPPDEALSCGYPSQISASPPNLKSSDAGWSPLNILGAAERP